MQEHTCRHNHESNNGFILGVIVGVILTLLMVTKKGRKILRMLTDESIEKISDLEKLLEQKMQEVQEKKEETEDEIAGDEYIKDRSVPAVVTPSAAIEPRPKPEPHGANHVKKTEEKPQGQAVTPTELVLESRPKHVRRFFRGVPKH